MKRTFTVEVDIDTEREQEFTAYAQGIETGYKIVINKNMELTEAQKWISLAHELGHVVSDVFKFPNHIEARKNTNLNLINKVEGEAWLVAEEIILRQKEKLYNKQDLNRLEAFRKE
jgi:Zn-dependent peptidase ImmA (M78 family)